MKPSSMWERSKQRSKQRSIGRVVAVALAALVVVAAPACSKDDKATSSSTTLDVNADPPNDPPTTTSPSTTVAETEPVESTTTEAVTGETFGGAIDGEDGEVDISFTKADGVIRNFAVRGLKIQCLPMAGGEATSRLIDVVMDPVPVGADGMVDYTDEDGDFAPQLSGSFADDGRFIGGLYLSQQVANDVCGGEFTFELAG
ncbi:MAG: hypothetical protein ABI239_02435 [Aquihabitans sp.]